VQSLHIGARRGKRNQKLILKSATRAHATSSALPEYATLVLVPSKLCAMSLPNLGHLALCATSAQDDEGWDEQAPTPYPTGVLGPVLHAVPGLIPSTVQPHAQPVMKPEPGPRFEGDEVYHHSIRDTTYMLKDVRHAQQFFLNGVVANGVSYTGFYTGTVKARSAIPEGLGILFVSDVTVQPMSPFAFVDSFLKGAPHNYDSNERDKAIALKRIWNIERATRGPAYLTIYGNWHEGQLVDGQVAVRESNGDFLTKTGMVITDYRPFGGTYHEASLLEEVGIGVPGTLDNFKEAASWKLLMSKRYAQRTEKVVSWLGYITLNLGGSIRWTVRVSEHKFAWAFPAEDVRMQDGSGTLAVDSDYGQITNNPVLSGRAEVTLTVRGPDNRNIRLLGDMVDNRLHGVVLAAEPIPGVSFAGNDYRFFIDGYDSGGVPIVRLLTDDEKNANPMPWRYPTFSGRHMNDETWQGWTKFLWWEFTTTWLGRLAKLVLGSGAMLGAKGLSEALKREKVVVMTIVNEHGWALRYASEELKRDEEVVILAVHQDGLALRYASEELKRDKRVVMIAVKQNGRALKYASEELKRDKYVVMTIVLEYGWALRYASEELKRDKHVVIFAVHQDGLALEYASEELKRDKEVVMIAVKQNGLALEYASEELKRDKEVAMAAVKQNGRALKYASEELKRDKDVLRALFRAAGAQ